MSRIPESKTVSAVTAIRKIRRGDRVFISSACAEPVHLVEALAGNYRQYFDVEILHLIASGTAHFIGPHFRDHFRYNTFCVGDVIAPALRDCAVDYTPLHLSELPRLLESRRYPVDAALISATPPDSEGRVSLGLSVGVTREAVRGASLVIAQINEELPRTCGATLLDMDEIDCFVLHDEAPVQVAPPRPPFLGREVGRFAAELVEDGDVLHVSFDPLAYAVLPYLVGKRQLGLHTDIFTDPLMELMERGIVTNATKPAYQGQTVASFVVGSQKLYDFVEDNPAVTLLPTRIVNDRGLISRHRRMIAIRSGLKADVTGNVMRDSLGTPTYRGIGGGLDFLRGAAHSERGLPIIVMTSADPASGESNIVARLSGGEGSIIHRASVHYICTEYGFAHLHAKTLRERVLAIVSIAHPRHRERLMDEAKALGYVPKDQMVTPYPGCLYPNELVHRARFKDGLSVFFRPIHPSDERGIQRFFYSHSARMIYYRYHGAIKTMPHAKVQQLTNIDYRKDLAMVGLAGERGAREIACVGRYMYYGDRCAEVDITVGEKYHRMGIGTFLLRYVTYIARRRGLKQLTAEILHANRGAQRLFNNIWTTGRRTIDEGVFTYVYELDPSDPPPDAPQA